ncbi:hypothetical protein RI367_002587 [Sorochytrium milnesiophthora]
MDQQPIELQALLGELISLRRENVETCAQLAQLNGSRAPAPNPAPALLPRDPTTEGFAGGAESLKNLLTAVEMVFTKADFAQRHLKQVDSTAADHLAEFRRLAANSGCDDYAMATFLRQGCREALKDCLSMQLHEIEALVLRLDQLVQERRRGRDLNRRLGSYAPARPRYEPSAPVYNSSNEVGSMVIDAFRRGNISDAQCTSCFREDPCLYCCNAGHHGDQCAELKAKGVKSDRSTAKTNKSNVSADSGSNPKPSAAATSFATSLSLKSDFRIDSDPMFSARPLIDSGATHSLIDPNLLHLTLFL